MLQLPTALRCGVRQRSELQDNVCCVRLGLGLADTGRTERCWATLVDTDADIGSGERQGVTTPEPHKRDKEGWSLSGSVLARRHPMAHGGSVRRRARVQQGVQSSRERVIEATTCRQPAPGRSAHRSGTCSAMSTTSLAAWPWLDLGSAGYDGMRILGGHADRYIGASFRHSEDMEKTEYRRGRRRHATVHVDKCRTRSCPMQSGSEALSNASAARILGIDTLRGQLSSDDASLTSG